LRPLLADSVLECDNQISLEALDQERDLLTHEPGVCCEHGSNLCEQLPVVTLLAQLPQDGVQAHERRFLHGSLPEALHRVIATDDEVIEQDRFLRREVAEDGATTYTSGVGDLIDRRLRVPLTDKELQTGFGDARPRRFGLSIANRSLGHARSS